MLVAADDSGTEGDNITDDDTPAFSGTTQADATVQLLNGTNVIGTATADAGGNYVVPVQSPLSPGTYQITVVASNVGGASPASRPASMMIVAPPATPSASTLLPADSNGSPGGETTTFDQSLPHRHDPRRRERPALNASGAVVNTTTANSAGSFESSLRARSALVRTPTKST